MTETVPSVNGPVRSFEPTLLANPAQNSGLVQDADTMLMHIATNTGV